MIFFILFAGTLYYDAQENIEEQDHVGMQGRESAGSQVNDNGGNSTDTLMGTAQVTENEAGEELSKPSNWYDSASQRGFPPNK